MASHMPCFVSPALPLTARPLQIARVATKSPTPTMSLRLPKFRLPNPFRSSGGSFNSHGGMGGGGSGGWQPPSGGRGTGGRSTGGTGGGAADDGGASNPFAALWRAYNSALASNPIVTKACTSLIGFFLGDLIAQKFLNGTTAEIDRGRLMRMASFGFLIHGPTGHYFYNALDRMIVGTSPLKVASKVVIDQILWAPIFTALFFAYLGFAEKKTVDEVKTKIKKDTWTGVTTSWKFWPLAHTINFAFVPGNQRLLYINTLQVGYNVILSLLGNK